ncbi:MAG: L,D-transpeptidase family protein [Solirubrobacterales bacterium]|nr:L,D-transpeptidase family protein [Solirubrobacterales bacterium]
MAVPDTTSWSSRRCGDPLATVAVCATLGLLVTACSGGAKSAARHGGHASVGTAAAAVRLSITPSSGSTDPAPNRGITVTAAGGRISRVIVRTAGDPVTGTLNVAGTVWHSTWALDVSQHYAVVATAVAVSGKPVTQTSSFRTVSPRQTFRAQIIEGSRQTYGVGTPIILFFSRPIVDKAAVERSLEVSASKPVMGAWYWDGSCRLAPMCLYFRTRGYWPTHTRVSFTGHLNGVEVAPGVYGHHTLTQTFTIGSSLSVVANTAGHYMNVYRGGRLFAHWPISSGRPGDDTPNGTYLTIEKENPVDMIGPGYNIEVPWSVRFTFSGDYLHDAYWSVGEQGFTNVSHGCVNMSPADAEIYYKMAVPGDPVKIIGSPRAGTWDNGWTVWFLPWKQWLRGSALHEAVQVGPDGSTFVSRASPLATPAAAPIRAPNAQRRSA